MHVPDSDLLAAVLRLAAAVIDFIRERTSGRR